MSLVFNKVILHNFGSYNHAEINLQNRGFCLVSGENNYEKDNALSNGAGKSFIWNAICFALTGVTLTGLHSNLKNINIPDDNTCFVTLDFMSGKDTYIITRYIAPKSDLEISKNGIDVSGKGIKESSKKLEELLPDITHELIASTIILGQGMPSKFSSFSPSGRKELLEKLTKSDFMLEDMRERVNTRQTVLTDKIREYEDSILVSKTKLQSITDTLASINNSLATAVKPDFDAELLKINTDILSISDRIKECEQLITANVAEHNKLTTTLTDLLDEKSKASQEELTAYSKAKSETATLYAQLQASINALNVEITKLKNISDICPTCGQKIPGVIKPDTSEQEAQLSTYKTSLTEAGAKLVDIESKHSTYVTDIEKAFKEDIDNTKTSISANQAANTKLTSDMLTYNSTLSSLKESLNKCSFEKTHWESQQTTLLNNKTACEQEIIQLNNTLTLVQTAMAELYEHLNIVKKMETLIKRDFRGYLLTNIISYLNKKAKEYSQIVFGTEDIEIYLDGNNLDISYCNRLLDNLSGGERTRVDLILQLSIRDLMCNYFGYSSNILVLDEVTDFLDAKSCAAVMQLITKQLNDIESVFIISHHSADLELPIDSELKIIKNIDGISEVY